MRRRALITALAATGWPGVLRSQTRPMPVVGILTNISSADMRVRTILEALRALGYIEGQNIRYEFRLSDGRPERLADLAKELASSGVDIIVAAATPATRAAQQATNTIPIVGSAMADPVRDGLVRNYASPEGNITGNTFLGPELVRKRLAYLKELLPSISRVHVLWHPDAFAKQTMDDMVAETGQAASALSLQLQFVAAARPSEFESAFEAIANDRPEALFQFPSQMFFATREEVVRLAAHHQI